MLLKTFSKSERRNPTLGRVTRRWLAGLGAGLSFGLVPGTVFAEPTGAQVLLGRLKQPVSHTGKHTLIETETHRTRIAWDNFNIAIDESVHVAQPSRDAALLNEVRDAAATNIDGVLTSNGQVWIINPAGVYFGGSAVVEVAGLIAAAGNISNESFVLGTRHFTNLVGEVRNDGSILADSVILLGRAVTNHGQIVTRGGDIVMAAGDDIWVGRHDTHIRVRMPHMDPSRPSVENAGVLDAGSGRARLAAGDFLGVAIRNTGEIRASGISLEAGAESVVDVRGTLDASDDSPGAEGGRIEISGDWILVDDASLDASGHAGGGTILLGRVGGVGGVAGGGSGDDGELRTARGTFVSDDSELRADALAQGDGGEIVVWSDEIAQVTGTISAEGGPLGGDGGFVETSSKGRIDVGARVFVGAPMGQPGTWLIDPVNVAIVSQAELTGILDANPIDPDDLDPFDPDAPKPIELFEFSDAGGAFFQPFQPHPDEINNPAVGPPPPPPTVPLEESLVSSESLEAALGRGGTIIVSTEARVLNLTSDDVGYIEVRDAIEIASDADVRPNTESELVLLATDDVRVMQPIASNNPDLKLSVTLRANDNTFFAGTGQAEDNTPHPDPAENGESRLRIGDVVVTAEIKTMGGNVTASGTNVQLLAKIDTSVPDPLDLGSPDPETNGGFVNILAADLVEDGVIDGEPDASDRYGNVTVGGEITTNGGSFLSGGERFDLNEGALIDVFRQSVDELDQTFGRVEVTHSADVLIDADVYAETLLLASGTSGVGDLRIGPATIAPVLRGRQIQLSAGDGDGDGGRNPNNGTDARIVIDSDVRFEKSTTERTAPPDVFTFTQDAFIRDLDLPDVGQFGGDSVAGMFYAITSFDGGDLMQPDIRIETPEKFEDADLVLIAPDSIEVGPLFGPQLDGTVSVQPANVTLGFAEGSMVTLESGIPRLMPSGDPDEDEGFFLIHAGRRRSGTGNLDFEDGVILEAPRIALRAGDSLPPEDDGSESMVNPGNAVFQISHSFEVRQDADITDANLPDPQNLVVAPPSNRIEYSILSDRGSITLTDPDKVLDSDVVLTALDGIELDELASPIRVHSADLGGFSGFQVTEDLLDNVIIDSGNDRRILTLRSGSGTLGFQSTKEDASGATVPVQLRVEAERIQLIGATINVATGRPLFQKNDATSPERLIFRQAGQIGDTVLPTADNYPDGLGPSELFVIESAIGVSLVHSGLDPRGWGFPAPGNVIVAASGVNGVNISRTDGFDLVLGPLDQIWSTDITFKAVFEGGQEPIGGGAVDAAELGSSGFTAEAPIRGFDASIDYTADVIDPPDEAVSRFVVDQDADFDLRTGFNGLPDFGTQLEFQPDTYGLISQKGSIQVKNTQLADTNLELSVRTPEGEFIDFESGSTLQVKSLIAQMGGDFEVGANDSVSGSDPTTIDAEGDLTLTAGTVAGGSLSFAPLVDLTAEKLSLLAGADDSIVDARSNDPMFEIRELEIFQGGDIRNGLEPVPPSEIDYGQVPALSQLRGYVRDTNPLERYLIETRTGDIEINDPSEVLVARSVELFAGAPDAPTTLTLRAEVLPTSTCVTTCGDPMLPDANNLILIDPDSGVQAVRLVAQQIFLEAPEGYVDAGDERVRFELLGTQPLLSIRQSEPVTLDDFERLPDSIQFIGGLATAPYQIQSLGGIELGAELADRVEQSNLVLIAGLPEDDFEAAFGADRLGGPVPDDDPEIPDHVYDRFADLNGDGTVDSIDKTEYDAILADNRRDVSVDIKDDASFDLILRTLTIESRPDDTAPIRLGSVHIQTESDQIYRDQVTLVGEVVEDGALVPTELTARAGLLTLLDPTLTARASSIVFEHTIDGQNAGAESLAVNATNRVRFLDEIGTNVRLGSLSINLGQLLQLQDPPPTPRAEFGSTDFTGDFRVLADEILLNPTSGDGDSRYARTRVPDAATFFRRGGSLTFDVGTGGTFTMGLNEKLSVDGSALRILAPDGSVTVGDLSALDLIRIDAGPPSGNGDIHMLRRDGGEAVRANGEVVKDIGVDFVARDIDFDFGFDPASDPTGSATLHANQVGSGKDARFGIDDASDAPRFMDDFSVVGLQFNILTGQDLGFLGGDLPIDGVPDGISRVSLSRSYAGPRPPVPIAVPAAYRVRNPQRLGDVGLALRAPSASELRSAAAGAATFYDLGSMKTAASGELVVSEPRLVSFEIERAAQLHDEVFAPDGSRAPHVREVLQAVADDYRRSTGTRRIVGFELRRYVYNRPSSQFHAYQELQKLDSLFRHHRRSGLTPTEYRAVQRRWLEAIRPEGITLRELAEFVHPSRYVRGSDVLDVFGD